MSILDPSNNPQNADKNSKASIIGTVVLIISILIIWLGYPFFLPWISALWPDINLVQTGTTFGTFGDTYGA